ncbi:MAG: chemotaxis protein CheC, partial [Planctomycetales bacterium]|nr:chemotaxis protein CheC [Planctomycetales bacterium]
VIGVDVAPGSQLILTFEEESGRQLAAALTGREFDPSAPWSDLEKSAVMETGNILGSAYLNELTRLTDRELRPSAPYFCQDFAASVLEQALMTQAMTTDRVLVCRTRFEFNQQRVQWSVFFVPSEELLQMMSDAVHSL